MEAIRKKKKPVAALYIFVITVTLAVLVWQLCIANWHNVLIALAALALYSVPQIMELGLKMRLPVLCECVVVAFAFCAQVLGEIMEYYVYIPLWDSLLHFVIGFLVASAGFVMIDRQNHRLGLHKRVKPWFAMFFSFSLAAAVGMLWEFFEFSADLITGTDMQKDFVVRSVSSVLLNPEGRNIPVVFDVESLVVNGELWDIGGYLDIGLYDTIKDMFVNCLGALSFCFFGWRYLARGGRHSLVESVMPVYIGEDETEPL